MSYQISKEKFDEAVSYIEFMQQHPKNEWPSIYKDGLNKFIKTKWPLVQERVLRKKTSKNTIACKFELNGGCTNPNCTFAHSGTSSEHGSPKRKPRCRFVSSDSGCTNTECPFTHPSTEWK